MYPARKLADEFAQDVVWTIEIQRDSLRWMKTWHPIVFYRH